MIMSLPNTESFEWQDDKACTPEDSDLFFVERGVSTEPARQICGGCEVRPDCLQYALDHGERFGIWGGVSERGRRRIRGMGITAMQYFQGVDNGTIVVPARGRPKLNLT